MKFSGVASFLMLSVSLMLPVGASAGAEKSRIKDEPVPNSRDVGELPAEGVREMLQGGQAIVYGVRGQCSDTQAPLFKDAIKSLAKLPDGLGEFFDAGVGYRISGRCGGKVPARAIGLSLYPTFTGESSLFFHRVDKVVIKVPDGG